MGYLRVLCLALSYLQCTQPLLGKSFENMGWNYIFTRTILSCIFPSNQVYQYQRRLNDDKTELIVITTHRNTSQNQYIGINIGDSLITPSSEPPRNLGVLFYSTCNRNDHVSKICKSINYNLYSIGKIRKYLDTPTAEKMINITHGLLQQSPLWCKRLQYIPATALPEQCRPDVVLAPHSCSESPTLAACWTKNRIQGAAAHL